MPREPDEMTSAQVKALLELIDTAICDYGSWRDKRDKILRGATKEQICALREFSEWFTEASLAELVPPAGAAPASPE